jgi:hypothetical protein
VPWDRDFMRGSKAYPGDFLPDLSPTGTPFLPPNNIQGLSRLPKLEYFAISKARLACPAAIGRGTAEDFTVK